MITLLFPYRDRELSRVKRSLDSLVLQSNTNFDVAFIDYGTSREKAKEVAQLIAKYPFARYQYSYHINTMWNKSRALNILIKELKTPYCFVADIDMIFHPDFVETLHQVKSPTATTYFQVGFLSKEETQQEKPFDKYTIKFESAPGATGLSLFPVQALQALRGFDEYYHLWGSEDTDVHDRLKHYGLTVSFYDKKILMLHQYHKIYRNIEDRYITRHITIKDIARKNYKYRLSQNEAKVTVVNTDKNWGEIQDKQTYERLLKPDHSIEVSLQKHKFENWLAQLPQDTPKGVFKYTLSGHNNTFSTILSRVMHRYTLKAASDQLLWFHINHLCNMKYLYSISSDCKSISYTIWKE